MGLTEQPGTKNKPTVSEYVYTRLREMVETGKLKPGMRLIHRDLAKELNTSNIPIIEAIRRLEHDGLVVSIPNRGAQVVDWTFEEMECAIQVRSYLEQMAAWYCAIRATDEQRAKLVELNKQYAQYSINNDYDGCRRTDAALHSLVVKCSGSRLLSRLLSNSRVITNTIGNITWLPPRIGNPNSHRELVDAIVSGDKETAKARAKEHIDGILATLHQAMEHRNIHP